MIGGKYPQEKPIIKSYVRTPNPPNSSYKPLKEI
jgi:hypothetical protein